MPSFVLAVISFGWTRCASLGQGLHRLRQYSAWVESKASEGRSCPACLGRYEEEFECLM